MADNDVDVNFKANFESMKSSMEGILSEMKSWGAKITGIFAGAFTSFIGYEGLSSIREWLNLGREAELVQTRLTAQLNATGHAAGFNTQQLIEMADELQKTTMFSDTAGKAAEGLMLQFTNVRGDVFKRAFAAAADAATVKGSGIEEEASSIARALDAPTQGMYRLSREGIRLTEQQKNMITTMVQTGNIIGAQNLILGELERKYHGVAEEVANNTSQGAWTRIKNEMADIREEIGRGLIPIFDKFLPYIKESVEWWHRLADIFVANSGNFADAWGRGLKYIGEVFEWLKGVAFSFATVVVDSLNTITGANSVTNFNSWFEILKKGFGEILLVIAKIGAALETAADNFTSAWRLAVQTIHAEFVTLSEQLKKIFVTDMPTYLQYMKEMFTYITNYDPTGVSYKLNAAMNASQRAAVDAHNRVFAFPGGHREYGPQLPEGPGALPTLGAIAPRQQTAEEKAAWSAVRGTASTLASDFSKNLKAAVGALGIDEQGNLKGWQGVQLALNAQQGGLQFPNRIKEDAPTGEAMRNTAQSFKASFEDFNTYYKRIATAAASETERPEAQTAENTKQIAREQRESAERERQFLKNQEKANADSNAKLDALIAKATGWS